MLWIKDKELVIIVFDCNLIYSLFCIKVFELRILVILLIFGIDFDLNIWDLLRCICMDVGGRVGSCLNKDGIVLLL